MKRLWNWLFGRKPLLMRAGGLSLRHGAVVTLTIRGPGEIDLEMRGQAANAVFCIEHGHMAAATDLWLGDRCTFAVGLARDVSVGRLAGSGTITASESS